MRPIVEQGDGFVRVQGMSACPDGFPIKGNANSGIYHMPIRCVLPAHRSRGLLHLRGHRNRQRLPRPDRPRIARTSDRPPLLIAGLPCPALCIPMLSIDAAGRVTGGSPQWVGRRQFGAGRVPLSRSLCKDRRHPRATFLVRRSSSTRHKRKRGAQSGSPLHCRWWPRSDLPSAWSRSSIRSDTVSMPTERRT